ncbi:MAG TPA: hypothetical protein VLG49_03995 [Rhabdochlamydiaceae bacterium]|nr:hypothetical protein [Rhabdochlamydiaceae bacterium]
MTNVPPVHGPGGPAEPTGPKKPPSEAEKFKELMRVQKTPETDPEEKKKRKRGEEAEDEAAAQAGGKQPPAPTEEPKKGKEVGPLEGPPSKAGPLSLASFAPGKAVPGIEGPETGYFPEESYVEEFSAGPAEPSEGVPQTPGYPQAVPPPSAPPMPQVGPPEAPQVEKAAPPQSGEQAQEKGKEKPKEGMMPPAVAPKKEGVPPAEKGKSPAVETPKNVREEERQKYLEEYAKAAPGGKPPEKKEGAPPPEIAAVPPPSAPIEGKPAEKEKEQKIQAPAGVEGQAGPGVMPPPPGAEILPPTQITPPSYAFLHPQVLEIFERMVGVMTIMNDANVRETTITLNNPQFASSVFFGAQIVIQEFSTAPFSYNIQFVGTPQGVALFQNNVEDLMAAFQGGNYNFRVNRIDTSLQGAERPLFKRKESAGGEEKGQDKRNR